MRTGFCAPPDKLDVLERNGIDCIELSVHQLRSLSDSERRDFKSRLAASPVRFETVNCLIGGFSLYEDDGLLRSRAHFDEVLPLFSEFGVNTLVFGSGGFRKVPEGYDRERAYEKIREFLRYLSEAVTPYNMTVAVEHLPVRSCNILNTTAEASELVRSVSLPNIRMLVDFWHLFYDGELLSALKPLSDILAHVHIANPIHGYAPAPGDGFDAASVVRALADIGYNGIISAEVLIPGDIEESVRGYKAVMDAAFREV